MIDSVTVVITHREDCTCPTCNLWRQLCPPGMDQEEWWNHLKSFAWDYADARQLKLFPDHVGGRPSPHMELLDI